MTFGYLCDDGSRSGSGAAALSRGDENHVGTVKGIADLFSMFLGRGLAYRWVAPGAETSGQFATDVNLGLRIAHQQSLSIGVNRYELDTAQSGVDHAINGITTATADTDHFYNGYIVLVIHQDPLGMKASLVSVITALIETD